MLAQSSADDDTNPPPSSAPCAKDAAEHVLLADSKNDKECSRWVATNTSMSGSALCGANDHLYFNAAGSPLCLSPLSETHIPSCNASPVLNRGEREEEEEEEEGVGASGITPPALSYADEGATVACAEKLGKDGPRFGEKKNHGTFRVATGGCSCTNVLKGAQGRATPVVIPTATAAAATVVNRERAGHFMPSVLFDHSVARFSSPEMSCCAFPQVAPRHGSVFYPDGIEHQPPVLLHYLVLGGWRTVAGGWDYFSHRRLQKGDIVGHTVRWLHTAHPRDRFVFVISPVDPKGKDETVQTWWKFWNRLFGVPPAFAYKKGKLLRQPPVGSAPNDSQTSFAGSREASSPSPSGSPVHIRDKGIGSRCNSSLGAHEPVTHSSEVQEERCISTGVEVVEVRHEDVTATDYSPRLLSSRFAIEAKAVYAYYFSSMEEAYAYYNCLEDLQLVVQQVQSGVTNMIPCSSTQIGKEASVSCGSHISEGVFSGGGTLEAASGVRTAATTTTMDSLDAAFCYTNDLPSAADVMLLASSRDRAHLLRSPSASMTSCETAQNNKEDWLSSQFSFVDTLRSDVPHEGLPQHTGDNSLSPPLRPTNIASDAFHSSDSSDSSTSGGDPKWAIPRVMPVPTTVHFDTIVTVYSEDPNFNAVLRELLIPEPATHPFTASPKEQRRMLSMYETGMPAWTVFLASTGLPYRRVFRLTFVGLVNIWPIISLFVGLYDLYKHLPQMKAFVSTTLQPLLEWVERRVTVRVSMLVTYIVSVGFSVAASFTSFLGQFYVLELISTPLRLIGRLLRSPFALLLQLIWIFISIAVSFLSLVWTTLKMLIVGPFVLVSHLASLEFGSSTSSTAVIPVAVEGTSLTMKWWRAWQEFWVTVASPVKNLAKAWYDSVVHIFLSAARREASIRRWYTPKLRSVAAFVERAWETCVVNLTIFWQLLGFGWILVLLHVALIINCTWVLLMPSTDANTSQAMASTTPLGAVSVVHEKGEAHLLTTDTKGVEQEIISTTANETREVTISSSFLFAHMIAGLLLNEGHSALCLVWEMLLAVWAQLPW